MVEQGGTWVQLERGLGAWAAVLRHIPAYTMVHSKSKQEQAVYNIMSSWWLTITNGAIW
jgi:hypothetical protein